MYTYICVGCGTQYAPSQSPPTECRICTDDRQYVSWAGQQWTTHENLAAGYTNRLETDGDVIGIGVSNGPDGTGFAIPQRAILVPSPHGNTLWDCVSLVTPQIITQLEELGGVARIAISHPHFYSSMVEWSNAFGGIPIHLHEADRDWVCRPSKTIQFWSGDTLNLAPGVHLIHTPGHFAGSTILHWTNGPNGKQVILSGDSLHVTADRRHVAFIRSVPNHLPLSRSTVQDLRHRLEGIDFDDVYGFTWGLNITGGARAAVETSFNRHLNAIEAS